MLDEVHDVGQTQECLLNDELILFNFVLPRLDIFRRVLMIEGQLIDSFADDLFECGEEAQVENDLCKLRLINQVSLNKEVTNGIHCHQIDPMLKLIGQFKYTCYGTLIVKHINWHAFGKRNS